MTVIKNKQKKNNVGKKFRLMYWFNNNTVTNVAVGYINGKLLNRPGQAKIYSGEFSDLLVLTPEFITWSGYRDLEKKYRQYQVIINRKNLEITQEYYENYKEKETIYYQSKGVCKVYQGFDYVKKYQDELRQKFKKSLENNKI